MRRTALLRSMLYALARALGVDTSALGQLEPSLVRKIGSIPFVALNFACTSAGVIDHAEPARWHVLHVRPFVPSGRKNGFVTSTFPYVSRSPEELKVKSGFGNRIPPERLSDAAKARPNRIGSLYRLE